MFESAFTLVDRAPGHFALACPRCRRRLSATAALARCPDCALRFTRERGIWRFLPPERELALRRFIAEYREVRRRERWGSPGPAYYHALPFRDLSGRFVETWRIRAASFQALLQRVVAPLEEAERRPLAVLDLGAGNGWLSHRLAERGHRLAAVDLCDDERDGLGAHVHYPTSFMPVLADFDHLPFADRQADLVVFNAALHYSEDVARTLAEAVRVLRQAGLLVVVDSPIYHDAESGRTMLAERERAFTRDHGFPSNAIANEGFLTYRRLEGLTAEVGVRWRLVRPATFWPMAVAGIVARLAGHRETATLPLIVGRQVEAR